MDPPVTGMPCQLARHMRAAAFAGCERGERRALQRLHAAARKCQRPSRARAPAATLDGPRDERRGGGALQCGTTRDVKERPVRWPGNLGGAPV